MFVSCLQLSTTSYSFNNAVSDYNSRLNPCSIGFAHRLRQDARLSPASVAVADRLSSIPALECPRVPLSLGRSLRARAMLPLRGRRSPEVGHREEVDGVAVEEVRWAVFDELGDSPNTWDYNLYLADMTSAASLAACTLSRLWSSTVTLWITEAHWFIILVKRSLASCSETE